MANPLEAFGYMPMNQALGMNWEQSRPAMGPIEAMAGMPDLYRQAAQQQYSNQPMADSFLRRFGQPMVEQQHSAQQPQMTPEMQQMLMGQLQSAVATDDDSMMMNVAGKGPQLFQGSGSLASQPWYDEYMTMAQQGGDLPMVHGNASGQSPEMKAGIAQRRQQRLEEAAPALSLADRKKNVMNKALIKSEQRAGRMGDISPNEMYFNQAGRFAGGMGEGGGDFLNGIFFGGQTAADMQGNKLKAQEAQATREWASSPEGIRAAQASGGLPVSSLYSLQQEQEDPQGFALRQAAGAAPDFESFVAMVGDRNLARQYWVQVGKADPDAPQRPLGQKLFGDILYKGFGFDDPNRSGSRAFLGNWLSDALGIQ